MEDFADWIGRSVTVQDTIAPFPCRALAATLNRGSPPPGHGDALPPLWHFLYFLECFPAAELGPDGHARASTLVPPVGLPRRMWAAGDFRFGATLRVGQTALRRSTLAGVTRKAGNTGSLAFVRLSHEITVHGTAAISETQDLVYRTTPGIGNPLAQPVAAPAGAVCEQGWTADEALLFRYSALTFNSHRIHYDRPYATQRELYPGLVVHGPLMATLLLELLTAARPDAALDAFRFRAMRPVFDGQQFAACGAPAPDGKTWRLWIRDQAGALAMDSTAVLH